MGVVILLAIGALLILVQGWLFMLVVGVVHHEWLPGVPAIGYWWAVLISFLISGALQATKDR